MRSISARYCVGDLARSGTSRTSSFWRLTSCSSRSNGPSKTSVVTVYAAMRLVLAPA